MGLFGFACGRCWDYNCSCTEDQLLGYEKECKENRENIKSIEYSKTEPKVCKGDVVVKGLEQYVVRRIVNGVAKVIPLSNSGHSLSMELNLIEPYSVIVNQIWNNEI